MTVSVSTSLTAGTWVGDPVHSDISFRIRHMAVGRTRGTFALTTATLVAGLGGIPDSAVTAVIDAASVDTRQDRRDTDVRSANFLDIRTYPTITFVSTAVRDFDGQRFVLAGDLTIHGTTNPVELIVEYLGQTVDAFGLTRAGFSASTAISRRSFGVSYDAAFGAGNAVVADRVEIALDLEFVRDAG